MFTRSLSCLALCLSLLCTTVHGATLPVPTVEYSAERVIEMESGTFTGKVYSAKGKERTETNMGGMQSVMILRLDQQLGYMLMPAQKMYQKLDLAQAQKQSGATPADQVEITEVGAESVAGHDATKYKMLMKDGSGGGFVWVTPEGIPVKMDLLSKQGREKTRMTMTLKNLAIGSQDATLFELPVGYSAMPSMGNFGVGQTTSAAPTAAPAKPTVLSGAMRSAFSHFDLRR
jgi:hypothetical protein